MSGNVKEVLNLLRNVLQVHDFVPEGSLLETGTTSLHLAPGNYSREKESSRNKAARPALSDYVTRKSDQYP